MGENPPIFGSTVQIQVLCLTHFGTLWCQSWEPTLLTLEAVEEQVRELHNQCLGCFGVGFLLNSNNIMILCICYNYIVSFSWMFVLIYCIYIYILLLYSVEHFTCFPTVPLCLFPSQFITSYFLWIIWPYTPKTQCRSHGRTAEDHEPGWWWDETSKGQVGGANLLWWHGGGVMRILEWVYIYILYIYYIYILEAEDGYKTKVKMEREIGFEFW